MHINPEFDFNLEEVLGQKWNKEESFENNVRIHWLGEFNQNNHIAYNAIEIYEKVKNSYGYREVSYEILIQADYYGEVVIRKQYSNIGLRQVKKNIIDTIKQGYENKSLKFKKRNLQ